MKVDLSAALKEPITSDFVKDDYCSIRVELTAPSGSTGNPTLEWSVYARALDGDDTAWSKASKTFDEALESLKLKLLPKDRFVQHE